MINRRVFALGAAIACICALLGPAVGPVAADQTRAAALGPKLHKVIEAQRQSRNLPGIAATVIFGDGSRWGGTSGQSIVSSDTPVDRATPFVVGSITKTFVASLILELAEEDKLALDDQLSTWLPEYPNAAGISLRQLLSHTSGVFDYFRHHDYNAQVFGDPSHSWLPDEILSTFQRAPWFEPGTDFRYSNTNYVLLGLVAEQVGGAPIGEQLKTRFWDSLGLDHTSIQSAGPAPLNAAHGYLWKKGHLRDVTDGSGYRPTRSAATVAWTVGDVVATADDVATWVHALYGGNVLSPASLGEMTNWSRYPGDGDYGLGTRTQEYAGFRMFGHTGSLRGYVAAAWHVPAEDVTVVVLTNRGRVNAQVAMAALMDEILTDTSPPSVPANLLATPQGSRYVQVSWSAATDNFPGGISYRVFRNGSAIGVRTTALGLLDRAPSVGTFKYRVRAIDAAGNRSPKSQSVSVRTFR